MSSLRKQYIISRFSSGEYVNGAWQEGEESAITIKASVQPVNSQEMDALPEGKRSSAAVKLYSDTELFPAKQATEEKEAVSADILLYRDKKWEITRCDPYQSSVIPHYKAYAVEVPE